jgi:hypothetical protein
MEYIPCICQRLRTGGAWKSQEKRINIVATFFCRFYFTFVPDFWACKAGKAPKSVDWILEIIDNLTTQKKLRVKN